MSDSRTFSETTNHIKELKLLLDQGILSQDEYEQQKNALLFPDGLPTPTAEAQPQQALKASQNPMRRPPQPTAQLKRKKPAINNLTKSSPLKSSLKTASSLKTNLTRKRKSYLESALLLPAKKDCCQTHHQDSGFNNHCIRNCLSYGAPSGPKL